MELYCIVGRREREKETTDRRRARCAVQCTWWWWMRWLVSSLSLAAAWARRPRAALRRACLDGCIWLGLSPQMQPAHVWMLGWSLGPGSTDARFLREPGSTHTPKTTVPREPGSSRARGCADAGKNGRAGAGGKRVGLPPHSRHHPAITGAPAAMLLARSPFVPVVPPFLTRLFLLTCFCQNLA